MQVQVNSLSSKDEDKTNIIVYPLDTKIVMNFYFKDRDGIMKHVPIMSQTSLDLVSFKIYLSLNILTNTIIITNIFSNILMHIL